uniref:HAT C-terminal dimerisation domain-containing protein n=1 Tax=Meloidogyne incognita TaxID=6306 RepID=A0A914LWW3_MELIC
MILYSLWNSGRASNINSTNLRKEFDEDCSMARESIKSDPLDFWKSNQKKFPLLSEAAQKYFSTPATSVPSEQLFSTARDDFTYRRMSIDARKLF